MLERPTMRLKLSNRAVVAGVNTLFISMALTANHLTGSGSDYLAARRCAGWCMLTVAEPVTAK
jgi:hypothetical protein